jgi:hypothetical protein
MYGTILSITTNGYVKNASESLIADRQLLRISTEHILTRGFLSVVIKKESLLGIKD